MRKTTKIIGILLAFCLLSGMTAFASGEASRGSGEGASAGLANPWRDATPEEIEEKRRAFRELKAMGPVKLSKEYDHSDMRMVALREKYGPFD